MHGILSAVLKGSNAMAAHLHLVRNEDTHSINLYGFIELVKYAESGMPGDDLLAEHSKEIKEMLKGLAAKQGDYTIIVRTHPSLASRSYGFYEFSVVERFANEQEMQKEIARLEKDGLIYQPTYKVVKMEQQSAGGHDRGVPEGRERIFYPEKKKG